MSTSRRLQQGRVTATSEASTSKTHTAVRAAAPALRTLSQRVRQAFSALVPRPAIAPKAVRFESLEPRLLLSGDPVFATLAANGALTLNLTDASETVVIDQLSSSANGAIISVKIGALVAQNFGTTNAGVLSIVGDGKLGNDVFTLKSNVAVPVTLQGGGGGDVFTVEAGVGAPVSLSGGAGNDIFNVQAGVAAPMSLDGGIDDDVFNVGASVAAPVTVLGGGGNDNLIDLTTNSTWDITGANAGSSASQIVFSGIQSLTGGTGEDTFFIRDGGTLSGTLSGGAGADAL